MAVRLARRTQNDYLIVKLIMKGASKTITDFKGRFPKDLLGSNSSDDVIADTTKIGIQHHLVNFPSSYDIGIRQ